MQSCIIICCNVPTSLNILVRFHLLYVHLKNLRAVIDYERKDRLLPRIEDLQTFMNRQLVWQLSGNPTLSQLYLLYPPDPTWNTQKNLNYYSCNQCGNYDGIEITT